MSKNWCSNYLYLNTGLIYERINCSLVLNGIMETNYANTAFIFLDLVRNYSGIGLTKLGEVYRQGAKYPVFMEVMYTRNFLDSNFKYLQNLFISQLDSFFSIKQASITSILMNSIYIVPLLILVLVWEMKRVNDECRAVIKSFKIIPKSYLLKMKTSKYLRDEQILNKIEKISF